MELNYPPKIQLNAQIIGERIQSLLTYEYIGEKNEGRLKQLLKDIGVENTRIIDRACSQNLMPKWSDLLAIAEYFNVSIDYLLGRTTVPAIAQPCANRIDSAIKTIAEYTEQSYDDVCEQLGISEDEIMNY